jgi:hypothetical protein
MRLTKRFLGVFLLLLPLFLMNTINALGSVEDDYTPDITARVARINVLRGDVQIRRAGSEDWERATLNLPLVEGDEITTSLGARLEIQFDSYNYLRLSENSYLKITTLRDEGVALSLPQGTLSLRAFEFIKDKTFFEIDAPKTTIAVQQAGMYRIDAGDSKSAEIRVTVTENGQARVYSESNGATLRSGRSMQIYIDGTYAGEWETSDAARYADDFDTWALERDAVLVKRFRDSLADKYYDRDIYGADDLTEHGEWIYTKKYGYVWKPYRTSTAAYADWSPYRYGHWRWIPPFGWTWVNDEPWGWATYHYGRWVYVDREWCWTPYASYRPRRSWWSPALVVVTYSGSLICWYPLPYNYGYYNYNHTTIINNTTIIKNTTVIVNPTPNPSPNVSPTPPVNTPLIRNVNNLPPFEWIPTTGVVAVEAVDFGKDKKGFKKVPTDVAEQILSKVPDEKQNPVLPSIKQLNGKVSREIVAETPKIAKIESPVKTGVTVREAGIPVSDKILKERVLDNRPVIEKSAETSVKSDTQIRNSVRDTGAVKRQESVVVQENNDTPVKPTRQNPVIKNEDDNPPIRSTGGGKTDRNNNPPVRNEQNDRDDNPPVRVPQKEREENNQPVKPPVYVPPVRNNDEPVKQPKEQPKKEEQKPQEQQKPKADRKVDGKES